MEKRNIEKVMSGGSMVELDWTTKVTIPEDKNDAEVPNYSVDDIKVDPKYVYPTTGEFIKAVDSMLAVCDTYQEAMLLNTALSYVRAFIAYRDMFKFEKSGEPTTEEQYKKLDEVLVHLPVPTVYEQLAEEYTECAKAALKIARIIRNENPTPITMREAKDNMLEEMADVDLVWKVLSLVRGTPKESIQDHDTRMYTKLDRWVGRLNGDDIDEEGK